MNDLFYLTDEQRMIRDRARKVARERVAPHAARYDEAEIYPEDSMRAITEAGLYAIWVPEQYGGTDMGCLALALVCEEIAYACAASGTQYLDQALGGLPILTAGSEAQRKKYLPGLTSGEILSAFSLPEPGAGSDAAGLTTTAVRRGDHSPCSTWRMSRPRQPPGPRFVSSRQTQRMSALPACASAKRSSVSKRILPKSPRNCGTNDARMAARPWLIVPVNSS